MWIMLDKGFISIVQHNDDADLLLVRARVGDDLRNVFGEDIDVLEDTAADYLYRTVISRQRVAETLRDAVMGLDYSSHAKDVALQRSAPARGRTDAYYDTWEAMAQMQPTPPYSTRWG